MRLLMYRGDGEPRPGLLHADRVVDLARLTALDARIPEVGTLLELIEVGPEALERLRALLEAPDLSERLGGAGPALVEVQVLAPLDPPRGDILCIGRNYYEHAVESARARSEEVTRPTVFTKAQSSISGPYDDIPVDHRITEQVDWEVELGVVLGRGGVNIPRGEALAHVFGYTVLNDISARDVQFGWGGQFFKGKSIDRFCPVGPWIVTADEVPDPQELRLTTKVNGTTKQDANTRDMIYPVDEVIAQLSFGMTLRPGTLIATGTPEGVGFARTPPEFLQPGDVLESEVAGIGLMRNRIVASESR